MSNINVTYDELQRVAGQIDSGREALGIQLQDLSRAVDGLVSSGFQMDVASGAYSEQFAQYTVNTTKAIDSLTGFSEFLRSAATALQETDNQLSNAIRGNG